MKNWTSNLVKQTGVAAVLTALFTFLINYQQQSRVDFTVMYDRQEEQIIDLLQKIEQQDKEIVKLKNQIATLQSLDYESPIPSWFKDLTGTMVMLNKAYEEAFLIPNGFDRYDYIGKTDLEFWGKMIGQEKLAKEYRQADLDVMMKRVQIRSIQNVYLDGQLHKVIVIKYPVWSNSPDWNGKKVIGVGGKAIFLEE